MTQYNYNEIKSDSLQQVVKFLDNLARDYFAEGYASNDYRKTCQQIGALSAVLDKLAEKMGDLWLFGADFVEDADQLRAFCAFVVAKAEKLAELAEVDNLTIITDAVARVEHWIAKGAETAKYFEEQAKAEQATAGSVEQLEAERAEVADLLATSERACAVLAKRIEEAKAEALTASKMNDREAWSTAEDKAVKLSAELDNLRALADADRAELDAIDNRLAFLKGQEEGRKQMNAPEATETATESENDNEQDNTPTEGGQTATEGEKAARREILRKCYEEAAKAAGLVAEFAKVATLKAVALVAFVLVLAVALGSLYGCIVGTSSALDALEGVGVVFPGMLRGCLCVVLLFTVILDLTAWAELQALALLNRLKAFEGFGGLGYEMEGVLFVRPFSIVGRLIETARA